MAYRRPTRNILRTLPVQQLRSPLPGTRLPGLGDLNCPGDPGCPGNLDTSNLPLIGPYTNPSPTTNAQLALAASGLNPDLSVAPTGSITDWLNTNASTVLWIGGVAVGLLILSKVVR